MLYAEIRLEEFAYSGVLEKSSMRRTLSAFAESDTILYYIRVTV
jgi:hypothetical protein